MKKTSLNNIILDIANSVSESTEIATSYLEGNKISVDKYISKGLLEIKGKSSLTKSETFFRRLVLAAEITNSCYNEKTFGSVKFQKLVYLCEHASKMNFSTNYSKQAAGPFDNKFMHSVGVGFKRQKWFDVKKIQEGQYKKVKYTPLESVEKYKSYYNNYYGEVDSEIQYIINTFLKSYTNEVELVATIYACWDEIINEKMIFSEKLIIQKVYSWSKQKKKFKEDDIKTKIDWMREKGFVPNND